MQCKVTMLYVGQGAMNLIEVCDDDDRLLNLSMVDCGGEVRESDDAIQYVWDKMYQRMETSGVGHPILDNLIITHRDKDHFNLFSEIFAPLIKKDGYFSVGKEVWCSKIGKNDLELYKKPIEASMQDGEKYTQIICRIENDHDIIVHSTFTSRPDKDELFHEVRAECYVKEDDDETKREKVLKFSWEEQGTGSFSCCDNSTYKCIANSIVEIPGCMLTVWMNNKMIAKGKIQTFENYKDFYAKCIKPNLGNIGIVGDVGDSILNIMEQIYPSVDKIEEEFLKEKEIPDMWINAAYIGGNTKQQTKKYKTMKNILALHCGNSNMSTFEGIQTGHRFHLYGPYQMMVLKRLDFNGSGLVHNNATSLIMTLFNSIGNDRKVVFPGDANAHTFKQWETKYTDQLDSFCNAYWLAPHHGSDSFKSKEERNDQCVFYRILRDSEAKDMVISAGKDNNFKHPYKSFIELMEMYYANMKMQVDAHMIRCNNTDSRYGKLDNQIIKYPLYTLCTDGIRTNYMCDRDPQVLLEDSRVFREIPRKPQEVPAPGLFFRRK